MSDAQDDLEEAYQKKEASVTLKIFKRKYDIDLNKMVQTRRAFNTKRKIQRGKQKSLPEEIFHFIA